MDAPSSVAFLIQELNRRYDALDAQMEILKAETENGEKKFGNKTGVSQPVQSVLTRQRIILTKST